MPVPDDYEWVSRRGWPDCHALHWLPEPGRGAIWACWEEDGLEPIPDRQLRIGGLLPQPDHEKPRCPACSARVLQVAGLR